MEASFSHLPRPAVFLDRDGTLIVEKNYLSRSEDVELLPGVVDSLIELRRAGYACVVVSNQSGIGRGFFTLAELRAVNKELIRQLRLGGADLDGVYFCPRAPTTSDKTVIDHFDRKPGPGMLLRAAQELALDVSQSWMVGDGLADLLAGRNAGCRGSILIRTGHDVADALIHVRDEPVLENLPEATRWILRADAS